MQIYIYIYIYILLYLLLSRVHDRDGHFLPLARKTTTMECWGAFLLPNVFFFSFANSHKDFIYFSWGDHERLEFCFHNALHACIAHGLPFQGVKTVTGNHNQDITIHWRGGTWCTKSHARLEFSFCRLLCALRGVALWSWRAMRGSSSASTQLCAARALHQQSHAQLELCSNRAQIWEFRVPNSVFEKGGGG